MLMHSAPIKIHVEDFIKVSIFKGAEFLGTSAIFHSFCDFLFVHSKPLLKKGLLKKKRICSQGEQILSF